MITFCNHFICIISCAEKDSLNRPAYSQEKPKMSSESLEYYAQYDYFYMSEVLKHEITLIR